MPPREYKNLAEFYPFYLGEHRDPTCRGLHVMGTTIFLCAAAAAAWLRAPWLVAGGVVGAYGCAWIGHFVFEKNRPATFKYPLLSLVSDFRFYFEVISGQRGISKGSDEGQNIRR